MFKDILKIAFTLLFSVSHAESVFCNFVVMKDLMHEISDNIKAYLI